MIDKETCGRILALVHKEVVPAIDRSIHNLTAIGANAMCITDEMVLNIMTNKHCSV